MTTFRLKHVKAYTDRHGKRRHYYRRPGAPSVTLPGDPGSKEFMEAYHAAETAAPREIGANRTKPGSFSALIVMYYKSREFADLGNKTKVTYRQAIEKFRAKHGDMSVNAMEARHVKSLLDGLPGRQENLRKVLHLLFTHAILYGFRKTHPMTGMRRPRKALKGFHAWSEGEIAAFEAKWPAGSRERLALALLLYTGQRRSDVILMGRQHVKGGTIRVVQQKTGTELWIALHSHLKAEIEASPKAHLNFLTTQYGEPFSSAGFGNWFADRAKKAGLPDACRAHGLRKAAARRLAEAGCSASQIMAVTGHKNLTELTLYTASADQQKLAAEAIARTEVTNPSNRVDKKAKKPSIFKG